MSTATKSVVGIYLSTVATFGAKTTVTYTGKAIAYAATKLLQGMHHAPEATKTAVKATAKHLAK